MSMTIAPVMRRLEVKADQQTAFETFTSRIDSWWPKMEYSLGAARVAAVVMENKVGGAIYEEWVDGERRPWGKVLVFEPHDRLVFTWHTGAGEERATEVEVNFIVDGDITRVELEHRGWEVFGEDAAGQREAYNGGWVEVLGRYTAAVG